MVIALSILILLVSSLSTAFDSLDFPDVAARQYDQSTPTYEDQWFHERYKYNIFFERKSWFKARQHCESIGSRLATINSAYDQRTFIKIYNATSKRINLAAEYRGSIWLGGTKLYASGEFKWAANPPRPLTYTNWKPGEPRNLNGYCMEILPLVDFKWNDVPCEDAHEYACEILY